MLEMMGDVFHALIATVSMAVIYLFKALHLQRKGKDELTSHLNHITLRLENLESRLTHLEVQRSDISHRLEVYRMDIEDWQHQREMAVRRRYDLGPQDLDPNPVLQSTVELSENEPKVAENLRTRFERV